MPIQIFWLEPAFRNHSVHFSVLVIGQTTFCLIHPIAIKCCIVLASFVVAAVLENIIEFEPVFATISMSLIVKTQYVYVLMTMI